MRFLIDMNLSPSWRDCLASGGHEGTHCMEVGLQSAPDRDVMQFARSQGLVVFTHDLDFGAILAFTGAETPSVVQVRMQDVDPGRICGQVLDALNHCREPLEVGALVTIDLHRAKARVLPIRSGLSSAQ